MPEQADKLLALPNLINIWSLVTFNTRLETLHVVLDPLLSFQSIKTIIVWFWTSSFSSSFWSSMYARDFSFIIDGCLPDISTFIHVTQWHSLKTERFKLTSVGFDGYRLQHFQFQSFSQLTLELFLKNSGVSRRYWELVDLLQEWSVLNR